LAALAAVALGGALAGCGGPSPTLHPPPAVGTCVTRSVDGDTTATAPVPCEGPHTHVISAYFPGVDHFGVGSDPCPNASDVGDLWGEGLVCLHPVPSTSP